MPPPVNMIGQNKPYFEICRELLFSIQSKVGIPEFDQLSMGTSADFDDAITCGSTLIRVGEAIMGKRSTKLLQ